MPIYIDSVGMATSLGNFITSCAAARAGVARVAELENMNFQDLNTFGAETLDGADAVTGHVSPQIAKGFSGYARTVELLRTALADLLKVPAEAGDQETALCLALPNLWLQDQYARQFPHLLLQTDRPPSELWRSEHAGVLLKLVQWLGTQRVAPSLAGADKHSVTFKGVHAALQRAAELLDNGVVERAIVGVVESRTEPSELLAAAGVRMLMTNDNPCGFIPGEAAVFLSVCRDAPATEAIAIQRMAELRDEAEVSESLPKGKKLAEVIRAVLGDEVPGWIIGGLNGTQARSEDWGHALVRLRQSQASWGRDIPSCYPALSFGETGVAGPGLAVAMCLHATRRGIMRRQPTLVWSASESGERQAFTIQPTSA